MGTRISIAIPVLVITGMVMTAAASAEIYKHVDKEGRITYSNAPMKGAEKLYLDPSPSRSSPKATAPDSFPKVNSKVQKQRDVRRREILETELVAEEKLLVDARQALKEDEANHAAPQISPTQSRHNIVKSAGKVKKLQEQVLLHESNITALKRELVR